MDNEFTAWKHVPAYNLDVLAAVMAGLGRCSISFPASTVPVAV